MERSEIRRLMACLLVNRDDVLFAMDKDWLATYDCLQKRVKKTNVATDFRYKRKYREFYGFRIDASLYFRILEREKSNLSVCFNDVLRELSEKRVQISFASKLVATINTDRPVYDSHVREDFAAHGVRFGTYNGKQMEQKLKNAIKNYRLLVETTDALVKHPDFATLKASFDKKFPHFCGFSDIKKLDIYMWWSAQV